LDIFLIFKLNVFTKFYEGCFASDLILLLPLGSAQGHFRSRICLSSTAVVTFSGIFIQTAVSKTMKSIISTFYPYMKKASTDLIIHHVPKLAITISSNTPNSFCSSWHSTKYRTLYYLTIDRALPCVFIVTSEFALAIS